MGKVPFIGEEAERLLGNAWADFAENLWGVQVKLGLEDDLPRFKQFVRKNISTDTADSYEDWFEDNE